MIKFNLNSAHGTALSNGTDYLFVYVSDWWFISCSMYFIYTPMGQYNSKKRGQISVIQSGICLIISILRKSRLSLLKKQIAISCSFCLFLFLAWRQEMNEDRWEKRLWRNTCWHLHKCKRLARKYLLHGNDTTHGDDTSGAHLMQQHAPSSLNFLLSLSCTLFQKPLHRFNTASGKDLHYNAV